MTPRANQRSSRAWAAMLCIASLAGFGCAKKITGVDPNFTVPEGKASDASILVVNRNLGNRAFFFRDFRPVSDREPEGPSPSDTLVGIELALSGTEGLVQGLIFDSTAANGYQVFTREANGGLRELFDFPLVPSQRWLDTHWEKYSFTDEGRGSAPAYQARGIIAGAVAGGSPVSNPANSPLADLSDLTNIPVDFPFPGNDSVLVISWPEIPAAAGYFVHAYSFRADFNRGHDLELQIATGAPAPIYDGAVNDGLLAYVSGGTSCNLGPSGSHVLAQRGIFRTKAYVVRVSAIDCSGRLIGFSFGEQSVFSLASLTPNPDRLSYLTYLIGGYVFPRPRPGGSPVLASRLRSAARLRPPPATGERITFRFP